MIKLGRQQGAILLKIDPDIPEPNEAALEHLANIGFRLAGDDDGFGGVQPRYVFRIDISPSEEELMAQMASKTRYNVRLAGRRGVKVRIGENKNDLGIFYDILKETAERDRFWSVTTVTLILCMIFSLKGELPVYFWQSMKVRLSPEPSLFAAGIGSGISMEHPAISVVM